MSDRSPASDGAETISRERLQEILRLLLDEGLVTRLRLTGASMSPLLRQGDLVILAPPGGRPIRAGDVVAFVADGRRLVIHRAVAAGHGRIHTRGDALGHGDRPLPEDDVVAVVSAAERRGRRLRLGLGPERRVVAWLSRRGWLAPLLRPWRRLVRP